MIKLPILCIALFAGTAFAQQIPGVAAAQPAQGRVPSNVRTNEQSGVNIDRFIGNPLNTPAHFSHGALITHTILTAGNPYEPGQPGAVLEYRKDLSTATLPGHSSTQLFTGADEFLFYVKSGEGRLDDGKQAWDLHEDMAILVPPNAAHRFVNNADKPLNMIMLTWTAAGNPKKDILVRDINLLPWCEENAHWNNASKCVFGRNDGLMESERVLIVMLPPWAASQPHVHPPGFEEIWTKISPGDGVMLLGSELRKFPENAAYRVPPNGLTEHSNLNLSEDKADWWIYVARDRSKQDLVTGIGTPGGIAANATPQPGPLPWAVIPARTGRNPNIVPDQTSPEAVRVADVRAKPLK